MQRRARDRDGKPIEPMTLGNMRAQGAALGVCLRRHTLRPCRPDRRQRLEIEPRLVIENPISAFNAAAILFGGGIVYAQIGNYMKENDDRVTRIEQQIRESNIIASVKDDRSTQKVEAITRDINDVKVTLRVVESSVQFLVEQVRQQNRRGPQ